MTPPNPRPTGGRVAIALASLTFLTAFIAAWQVYRASCSQTDTANRAITNYAHFAGYTLAKEASRELDFGVRAALRPIAVMDARAPKDLPPAGIVLDGNRAAMECDCVPATRPDFAFRVDLDDAWGTPAANESAAEFTAVGDSIPPEVLRQWIVSRVYRGAPNARSPRTEMRTSTTMLGERALLVAYAYVRDTASHPRAAYGFVSGLAPLARAVFPSVIGRQSIYLPAESQYAPNDSVLSVVVRDRAGHTLYTSPSPYQIRHPSWLVMPGPFDELTLSAAVRPAFYSRIVGEVWTWDRAQLVIGLITLSAGLIVVTLFQLRRERAIARLRSEFVSSVSHELRTPLAQIRMFAEMLRLGWVRSEAEGARSIAIIDQEARRLTHLVENVLHFSRIERGAGVAPLARLPIALAPLVDDVLAGFAPLASAAGISVRAQVPGTCVALADRDALRQVLLNLLDNAVKYGPKGQTVCIGAASVMDGAIIQMWVDDEGPGIPMRERARIWEPFRRLGRDVRAGVTGNGIGLAVVRELVVAQHGRTWVETAPGNGARILLELPAGSLPPAATEAIDTPPAAGTIAPRSLSRV